MTDGLLYKKDTDFVRDNMLINYCLGDDESLLIESFVRNNGICLRFDVGRFYFFMTGTHKKFVTGYTPMTFSEGVDSALAIYDLMLETLRQNGFDGNAFLVKIDNSKQVGVLFSPCADAACPADEMAQKMLDAYTRAKDLSGEDCTSTSFVGPFSGYDQIHKAFVQARALNDLIFFGVRGRVITEDFRRETARPCDSTAIVGNVRKLMHLLCVGTCAQALRQAEYIVDALVAPSYSMANFDAMYASTEDIRSMIEIVYDIPITRREKTSFFFLTDYRQKLCDAIRYFFARMEGRKRYSPTVLLALSYIRRNFTQEISLTQLSEYVYANASVLSRDFGAEVGMTLTEYVAALRVERAKRLLAENERTIEKIAEECGYTGAKYFREQFKRLTGLSPQAYRAKMTADA